MDVPALTWSELGGAGDPAAKASPAVRERVLEARARAARRARSQPSRAARRGTRGTRSNGGPQRRAPAVPDSGLDAGGRGGPGGRRGAVHPRELESGARSLLRLAVERFGLSARGFHRTLRVARTIADLAGSERIGEDEVAEALRYRGESADGAGP